MSGGRRDRTREVIDAATILSGWVANFRERARLRPDDEDLPERSRRMLARDLADKAVPLLVEGNSGLLDFIAELNSPRTPLSPLDAVEQIDNIVRHLCVSYNVDPKKLRPRKGFEPLRQPGDRDRQITVRLRSDPTLQERRSPTD